MSMFGQDIVDYKYKFMTRRACVRARAVAVAVAVAGGAVNATRGQRKWTDTHRDCRSQPG